MTDAFSEGIKVISSDGKGLVCGIKLAEQDCSTPGIDTGPAASCDQKPAGTPCRMPDSTVGACNQSEENHRFMVCMPSPGGSTPADRAPSPKADECLPQASVTDCSNQVTNATEYCDHKTNPVITTAVSSVDQITRALTTRTAGDTHAACGSLGPATQTLSGAVATYKMYCTQKRTNCIDSCTETKNQALDCLTKKYKNDDAFTPEKRSAYVSELTESIRQCRALENSANGAMESLSNMAGLAKQAAGCKDETDGQDDCALHPELPACQQKLAEDCSNPTYRAANKICTCFGEFGNANSAECKIAQKETRNDAIGSGGNMALGGGALGGKSSGDLDMGGSGLDDENMKINPVAFGEDPGGAKGGHGFSGSGVGGQMGGGGSGKGGGMPPEEKNPVGYMGQNPNSSGGFLGGVSKAVKNFLGIAEKKPEKDPKLDLFRPNLQKPRITMRGLAGTTGPDGITGPHSDIWMKVKNQYNLQLSSLMH